jgi:hypothetical protein
MNSERYFGRVSKVRHVLAASRLRVKISVSRRSGGFISPTISIGQTFGQQKNPEAGKPSGLFSSHSTETVNTT